MWLIYLQIRWVDQEIQKNGNSSRDPDGRRMDIDENPAETSYRDRQRRREKGRMRLRRRFIFTTEHVNKNKCQRFTLPLSFPHFLINIYNVSYLFINFHILMLVCFYRKKYLKIICERGKKSFLRQKTRKSYLFSIYWPNYMGLFLFSHILRNFLSLKN